jgi:uncharacterized membrane protein
VGVFFRIVGAWRRSIWVLPALVVAAGVVAAWVLVLTDPSISGLQSLAPSLFTVSPDGARGVLTAIATSMLSVAGVVFSITIATLSLTSQQFTSRVLRTFVRDRGNQLVLGIFLSVFAYCLVVLRSVPSSASGSGSVPQLAVLVGVALAFVGVAFLIYFIDHVASSIQASTIISRIAEETIDVLGRRRRDSAGHVPEVLSFDVESSDGVVVAGGDGYVTAVDMRALGRVAARQGWRIRMAVKVGRFAARGDPLLCVRADDGGSVRLGAEEVAGLRRGVEQTSSGEIHSDPSFGIRQLVDIALKALSPGVNDVTTALTCIDYLGAVLVIAGDHVRHDDVWRDEQDEPRVGVIGRGFDELLGEAMDQIRENGAGQVAALMRLMDVLERLAERAGTTARREELAAHARKIGDAARRELSSPAEAELVVARVHALLVELSAPGRVVGRAVSTA